VDQRIEARLAAISDHEVGHGFSGPERNAVLYTRNVITGELVQADVVSDGDRGDRFGWPTCSVVSPDTKFAYVLDGGRSRRAGHSTKKARTVLYWR
jgi:hypothetical protein